ncbi:hypothetical protein Tco_1000426 [Tanacetum coccineum]
METQAIDDQDPLVNYDNDNENYNLGYQLEEYFDEVQEDDENNHSNGYVANKGITRLYKFRREYGKPDGINLSVTLDALNRISGKHRALFSSFCRRHGSRNQMFYTKSPYSSSTGTVVLRLTGTVLLSTNLATGTEISTKFYWHFDI